MADLVKELWEQLTETAVDALKNEMSMHGPGDPFDYIPWAEFGSPIETAMFLALASNAHDSFITTLLYHPRRTLTNASASPVDALEPYVIGYTFGGDDGRDTKRRIFPQCNVGKYRVDFLVEQGWAGGVSRVVVECDGHDFHERTKEQARRDKARDRYMQTFGLSVLRFAGSEIHKDPYGCAEQVQEFFEARDHEFFLAAEAEYEARRKEKK